ncbi:ATP-binding protein [Alicyclobacillus ferrooxydans]|uniref:histidine kinase n=1 Tax=Alicyclobacillus ferrooxydans TaxID=471514 RepID=A0A0P9GT87_9BACL|nr:ATP-binding protein [Alicyclobacillus ferrooxydans]KPV44355.1 hypothetical protein AN477_06895 [Alicyclobacillus ferrooxydans]
MRSRIRWSKRTWFFIWLYAVSLPILSIVTDYLYHVWTHHLSRSDVYFISGRSLILYIFTVWLLTQFVRRLTKTEHNYQLVVTELETFIEHHPDAICMFDLEGRFTNVNTQFEELYKTPRRTVLGERLLDFPVIPPEFLFESQQVMKSVIEGQNVVRYRTTRQTAAGDPIPVSISAFPIRDPRGTLIGWAASIRDVSDEVETEKRWLQSEKLAAVGQLAAGVAHEIRNPLTAVKGFLDIIPTSKPEKQKEYAGIMTSELDRIANIVTEMLALAKPQIDDMRLVDVGAVLSQVTRFLDPEARMRNIVFESAFGELNVKIMGHENRLKQLLINLVRNAMDAIVSERRQVTFAAETRDSWVVIRIQDTGMGMTDDALHRICEPFFTTKEHGTGLGLHLCRQIVEQHEGRMQFASTLGEGTTVRLEFPAVSSLRVVPRSEVGEQRDKIGQYVG